MIKIYATKDVEVILDIGKLDSKIKKALSSGLHDAGAEVKREIKRNIRTGPRTGRIYMFRGKRHQASSPGEAPANRSGRLAKSTKFRVRGFSQMEVGVEAFYANFLESGTKKMKPRPYIARAVNDTTGVVELSLINAINEAIGI